MAPITNGSTVCVRQGTTMPSTNAIFAASPAGRWNRVTISPAPAKMMRIARAIRLSMDPMQQHRAVVRGVRPVRRRVGTIQQPIRQHLLLLQEIL